MEGQKIVQFDFGKVAMHRSDRARYLRLKVHPEKGISAVLPKNCTEKHAIEFILRKESWIRKSLGKADSMRRKNTLFSELTQFSTKRRTLVIAKHNKATLKAEIKSNRIAVSYPEFADVSDAKIQAFIRHTITESLRLEAKEYLPQRTRVFAVKKGLQCNVVSVRNNKSRWGSCSGRNNISLNIHLMRLPDNLIDYVILHELAHIKHKNHSEGFWTYLEEICLNAKSLDKELNNYHLDYW